MNHNKDTRKNKLLRLEGTSSGGPKALAATVTSFGFRGTGFRVLMYKETLNSHARSAMVSGRLHSPSQ